MGSGSGPPQGPPGRRNTEDRQRRQDGMILVVPQSSYTGRSVSRVRLGKHLCPPSSVVRPQGRALNNESDQANRAISTGKLHALLHFHTRPINVVVFHGSQGRTRFEVGFPLRCLQRLSRPHVATLLCGWRHNRSTRGASIPVLSY